MSRYLSKGQNSPQYPNRKTPLNLILLDFTRKIKILEVFANKESEDVSLHRNKSNRPIHTSNKEINTICNFIELLEPDKHFAKDNLSNKGRIGSQDLTERDDIVIKRADEGGNFVIMDKLVMQDHLNSNGNDYEETALNQGELVMKNIKTFVKKHKDILTSKEQYFITDFCVEKQQFYVLPKINKSKEIINTITKSNREYIEMSPSHNLKGRLILAPVSPTRRLSEFLNALLKPFISALSTYVKDDWDFLRKLPYEPLEKESRLYSCDVVSLYTNIPHILGLEAIDY